MIGQGRIQDFSQGGARYKIYENGTARSAVPFSREERKFLGGSPPHKHNYG